MAVNLFLRIHNYKKQAETIIMPKRYKIFGTKSIYVEYIYVTFQKRVKLKMKWPFIPRRTTIIQHISIFNKINVNRGGFF